MATDLSVLKYQPPAGPSALEEAGQFANLQALAGQKQLQQQQIQEGQLNLQEKQRQIARSKSLDKVYTDSYGPKGLDIDKFTQNASAAGLGSMIGPVQEHYTAFQKNLAETAKANAEAATAQANVAARLAVHLADPEIDYDPHTFVVNTLQAVQSGAIPQATAQPILQSVQSALAQDPTGASAKAVLKQWAPSAIAASPEQTARLQKEREIASSEKTSQSKADQVKREQAKDDAALAAKAESTLFANYALAAPEHKAEVLAQMTPAQQKKVSGMSDDDVLRLGMTPAEIAADKRGKATAANTERHEKIQEFYAGQHLSVDQARLKIEQEKAATGDDPLAGRSDADIKRLTAQAAGLLPPPTPRSKDYRSDMDAIYALDGSYKESRYLGRKALTTGPDADTLVSLTTALSHLERSKISSDAMGTVASGLSPYVPGKLQSSSQKRFDIDSQLVTAEIGRLIKHGIVPETEANRMIANTQSSNAKTRDAGLDELSELMSGRFEGIRQKYRNASGSDLPLDFFDAKTQDRMRKMGVEGAAYAAPGAGAPGTPPAAAPGAPVTAPGAAGQFVVNTPSGPIAFKTPGAANAFKKKAGLP